MSWLMRCWLALASLLVCSVGVVSCGNVAAAAVAVAVVVVSLSDKGNGKLGSAWNVDVDGSVAVVIGASVSAGVDSLGTWALITVLANAFRFIHCDDVSVVHVSCACRVSPPPSSNNSTIDNACSYSFKIKCLTVGPKNERTVCARKNSSQVIWCLCSWACCSLLQQA